jgi:upstream activation factor subunit UAF30
MPAKKSNTKTQNTAVENKPEPVVQKDKAVVVPPPATPTSAKGKKEKPVKKGVETPLPTVVEKVKEEVKEEPETVSDVEHVEVKTGKRKPTKESVLKNFDDLLQLLNDEIAANRSSNTRVKGVKFLRSLNKKLLVLRAHTARVMKKKQSTNRVNKNSGFLKPVQVSAEILKFTGWNDNELKSRVDVTKFICNYIKEKNLQDPADRRNILVDKPLGKLLAYNPATETEKLTYYRLQTYLKKHFVVSSK